MGVAVGWSGSTVDVEDGMAVGVAGMRWTIMTGGGTVLTGGFTVSDDGVTIERQPAAVIARLPSKEKTNAK